MLLFQPKKRFFENQCSENEAKLCDIGRCAIFTKDKLKFLLLFYCKIFFLQLSLLENGIFVVTFIVIWFGYGSVHRTTWFGRTTEPHRTFKFGRTRSRTVRSITNFDVWNWKFANVELQGLSILTAQIHLTSNIILHNNRLLLFCHFSTKLIKSIYLLSGFLRMKILILLTCQETIRIKVILRQLMDWIYLSDGNTFYIFPESAEFPVTCCFWFEEAFLLLRSNAETELNSILLRYVIVRLFLSSLSSQHTIVKSESFTFNFYMFQDWCKWRGHWIWSCQEKWRPGKSESFYFCACSFKIQFCVENFGWS